MIETKIFAGGGMNQDDNPSYLESNSYISAFNAILNGNIEGEAGDISNLISTREILGYTLPAGLNKCIGAERFENERIIVAFIYNAFGYHQFLEYNYDDDEKTLLFTNLTDSAGENVLPLTVSNYLSDIKLIDGRIVVFTDSNMEVGYINKERLKDGSYGVLTADDWRLIKAQPLKIPTAVYNDDANRVVNLLKNELFQFRNEWTYLDDEPSAWSSISKRGVPEKESTSSIGEDVTKNNNLIVTVDIGTNRVDEINIASRYALYDWFIIKSVKRDYVLALPETTIDIDEEIYEAYNPTSNTYSFVFYNDGSYVNINPTETDSEYDRVPQKAETLELLESNILALGGLTEGYERPVVPVGITVTDYDPQLQFGSFDPDPLRIITMYDTDPFLQIHKRKIWIVFDGVAKTGDDIRIQVADFRNAQNTKLYQYEVEPEFNGNTLGALQKMAVQMSGTGVATVAYEENGQYILTWVDFQYYSAANGSYAKVDLSSVGSGESASIHALKSNSAYQLALQYYDRYGRTFPLITGNDYIFKTNSFAQSEGLTPRIAWQIMGDAPVGAESYQWLLSENTTHQTTLYVNGKYLRTDGNYITLSINPLKVFNERNSSSILNYDYSEGDRVTFMYYSDNSNNNKVYFNDPFIDVQVVGFEIVVDTTPEPDTTTYELKVRLNPNLDISDITGKNIYMEIYTPKKRVVTNGETTTYLTNLFYEIGEQFNITNGIHDVLSGTITDGDVFFQTRDYVSAVDETTYAGYLAEDFNFSAIYESAYTSYGRGFLYNERDGIKVRKAGIRYSDKFVIDSKLNRLNTFYAERLYGDNDGESSSKYGWIRKIRQRDNYLICIQETKEGHIPIFQSIVEDQEAQSQAFLSDKLFNKIRYSQTGFIGMGNAPESYSESPNGTIAFIDPNNSVPMRDGYNGLTNIAGKMSKFFKGSLQASKQKGLPTISYWDNYTEKRVFSTQDDEDIITQVPINDTSLIYLEQYSVLKTDITITEQPTNATVTFIGDEWVITPDEGETGSGTFKFSFDVDGETIEKNGCFTIIAGDTDPSPFIFVDFINQDLSTLVYSNLILINNINVPVPISIVGGQYSINGGSWTSVAGTVINNDQVQVRQTTSASLNTTTTATLTVGSYSDAFDAKTVAVAEVGIVVVDMEGDGTIDTYAYIDTVGVAENGSIGQPNNIAALDGFNFFETTDTAEDAFILASDEMSGPVDPLITRRFQFNLQKLNDLYPDIVAIPKFIYKIYGRQDTAGMLQSYYSIKSTDNIMIMGGTAGTYIPNVSPNIAQPTPQPVSTYVTGGADGTIAFGMGRRIYTLEYVRATNIATLIPATAVTVACGSEAGYSGGESFPTEIVITLGTGLGTVNLNYDAIDVPDKFILIFDGVEVIDTGYRGDVSYQDELDDELASRGLAPETIMGVGVGTASFVKSTATTTAILRVYGPITGTSWDAEVQCPTP